LLQGFLKAVDQGIHGGWEEVPGNVPGVVWRFRFTLFPGLNAEEKGPRQGIPGMRSKRDRIFAPLVKLVLIFRPTGNPGRNSGPEVKVCAN
jgi:hypothetical protein